MERNFSVLTVFLVLVLTSITFSQDNAFLITYGSKANVSEGDNDFKQIVYVQIPASSTDSLYLRILDAECGGNRDSRYGAGWDTETRFSFYGGVDAVPVKSPKFPLQKYMNLSSGTLLFQETISENALIDDRWHNFAHFTAKDGGLSGEYCYFRLVIEGISGDDGNTYDISISTNPKRNLPPDGLSVFSYDPTLRLPSSGIIGEIRFNAPAGFKEFTVFNFDGAGASIAVETAFRSDLTINASGQGEWAGSKVELHKNEINLESAIYFEGGVEIPNDATFYITDRDSVLVPMQLPVYIHKHNSRPVTDVKLKPLTGKNTMMFDASASKDADGDPLSFFWDFGDGQTATGSRVVHQYKQGGEYSAELIVNDASNTVGNSSIKTFTVSLNAPPIAVAGANQVSISGELLQFDGTASKDSDGKIVKYSWDFGDGSKSDGATVSHAFRKPGYYIVTLRVEDDSDNPDNARTDKLEVWINAPPVVEIGDDIICSPNESITLSGQNSNDSDGEIDKYQWDLGDGTTKEGMIIKHDYKKPGAYNVKLTVYDNANVVNSFSSDMLKVFVNDRPDAKFTFPRQFVSVGDEVRFDGSSSVDRDGKIIAYRWKFGDGATQEVKIAAHSYSQSGKYLVSLNVQDNSTSSSDTDTDSMYININFPPVANAGADQYLTNSKIYFNGNTSSDRDGNLIKYAWEFGDGFRSGEIEPEHVYANPGKYEVKLSVTDDSETSTNTTSDFMNVRINETPVADAGPSKIGAPGEKLDFDGSSSVDPDGEISVYEWNFGDGSEGRGKTVSHTYNKPGRYAVSLLVKDNSGHELAFDYDETTVFVNAPPVADAGEDIKAAPGQKITLDSGNSYDIDGKIEAYRWDFTDGYETQNKSKIIRSFDTPGFYTATLTVTDNSGAINARTQDKILIHINNSPESNPGNDILINRLTVDFDGSKSTDSDGDELTYSWDFGDGSPSKKGVTVLHSYADFGVYPVILTVDDGTNLSNSTNSVSMTVSINKAPIAKAGDNKVVSAGDVVLFDGGASIDLEGGRMKYSWDFGDGVKDEGVNPVKTFAKGGVYLVTLRVDDDSGLPENYDTDQIMMRVAESPVAEAGPDQTVSINSEVHFDGTKSTDIDGMVNSYNWDFGDGFTGGGPTPTHAYTEPGKYVVTLTVIGDQILEEGSNKDSDKMIITVHDAPRAKFTYETMVSVGTPVTFDASESECSTDTIITYNWDFGDSTFAEGIKEEKTYNKYGRYFVSLTVHTTSQTNVNSAVTKKLIIINQPPTAIAGQDKLIGINETAMFDGSASNDVDGIVASYKWDFGDGEKMEGIQVKHLYKEAGRYPVMLEVWDDSGLEKNWSKDTLWVTVNAQPVPVIVYNTTGSASEQIQFKADKSSDPDGMIARYTWNFGDGGSADSSFVNHAFEKPGSYQVVLTVDDGRNVVNSKKDTTVTVKINYPPIALAGSDKIAGVNDDVKFSGSRSNDIDGKIAKYKWDFGDGTIGEGENPAHKYSKPGTYKIKLTVIDDSETRSNWAENYCSVRINAAPVAVAGPDQTAYFGGAHDAVLFDGTKSYDPDNEPLNYFWDFGDGGKANGPKVSHTYKKAGKYTVKLRVVDDSGASNNENADESIVEVKEHLTSSSK